MPVTHCLLGRMGISWPVRIGDIRGNKTDRQLVFRDHRDTVTHLAEEVSAVEQNRFCVVRRPHADDAIISHFVGVCMILRTQVCQIPRVDHHPRKLGLGLDNLGLRILGGSSQILELGCGDLTSAGPLTHSCL